jgi:hypothetical protein
MCPLQIGGAHGGRPFLQVCALHHAQPPYTVTSISRAFFDTIVRLHGIPSSIISDRDPVFTRMFLCELFMLAGVKRNLTTDFHPQSDGQSEAMNKVITMYLRCLAGDWPQ